MHACRWIGGWTGAFIINAIIASYFLTFGVGFGIWAALKNLVNNINKYSVFANCYQVRLCTDLLLVFSRMPLPDPLAASHACKNLMKVCRLQMTSIVHYAVRRHCEDKQLDRLNTIQRGTRVQDELLGLGCLRAFKEVTLVRT